MFDKRAVIFADKKCPTQKCPTQKCSKQKCPTQKCSKQKCPTQKCSKRHTFRSHSRSNTFLRCTI